MVAHADGLRQLEYFNTRPEKDQWSTLASLPELCGVDGVAIAGHRTKVISLLFFMFFKLLKRPKIEDRGTFFGFTTSNVVALRVCFYPPCTTYVLPLMRIEMVFSIPFWCRKISTVTAFEFQMWHSWWFPSLCEFVCSKVKVKRGRKKLFCRRINESPFSSSFVSLYLVSTDVRFACCKVIGTTMAFFGLWQKAFYYDGKPSSSFIVFCITQPTFRRIKIMS